VKLLSQNDVLTGSHEPRTSVSLNPALSMYSDNDSRVGLR